MAIIPFKPFDELDRFFEDENWLTIPRVRMGIKFPEMDVYEKDNNVIAEINVPGFDPSKFDISVKEGILRVRGDMEEKKEEKDKDYWRKEIRSSSFERAVSLPSSVDEEKIDATYEKGVLKIVIPKSAEKKEGRKIEVKSK
ncbi:MAG: Hsp20/alpha crystallin family protein [Candidatus Staskawiczbacteria bacterium]|nr:Hsp20/alpha crystallin family protein [Candidatus Staskawiczbacteria bacterium]